MGYNGQTEFLTDTANTVDSTSKTAPWTSSTGSGTVESQGGGDLLYKTDVDLVKNALGTLKANKVFESEDVVVCGENQLRDFDVERKEKLNGN